MFLEDNNFDMHEKKGEIYLSIPRELDASAELRRLACKLAYGRLMLGYQPSAGTGALRAPQRPFGPILRIL